MSWIRTAKTALLALLATTAWAGGSEPKTYPLWDGKESQGEYAKRAGPEPTLTLDLGGVALEMVLIPAGKFTMGSPDGEARAARNERPQHEVTITRPFYMGKTEITQQQWEKVMGSPKDAKPTVPDLPAVAMNYDAALAFCAKLSKATGRSVLLPTEAQWEFACRSGTTTRYFFGDKDEELDKYAWHVANSDNKVHPVGQKAPNPFGLCDILGNVTEWTRDAYAEYDERPARDPNKRVTMFGEAIQRGGCFCLNAWYCRSAARFRMQEVRGCVFAGLRVVAEVRD